MVFGDVCPEDDEEESLLGSAARVKLRKMIMKIVSV
jgi:hypothetical protein